MESMSKEEFLKYMRLTFIAVDPISNRFAAYIYIYKTSNEIEVIKQPPQSAPLPTV
jgi:hypothetical protein